jgi:hypothetical protein
MKRRVIQQNPTTLAMSLPAKWARQFGVKKGFELDVLEKGNQLVLSPFGVDNVEKAKVDLKGLQPLIRRTIAALYKKGYDELELSYETDDEFKSVEAPIDLEAQSFEIMKQSKGFCVIKSISELSSEEFDNVWRRNLLITKEMAFGILEAVKNQDYETVLKMKEFEKTNNKFTHMCRRTLNKFGYKEYENTSLMYTIIEMQENLVDELKFLCDNLVEYKIKLSPESFRVFNDFLQMLILFNDFFYKFDQKKVVEFSELRKIIVKNGKALLVSLKGAENLAIHNLLASAQKLFELLGPYLAMRS